MHLQKWYDNWSEREHSKLRNSECVWCGFSWKFSFSAFSGIGEYFSQKTRTRQHSENNSWESLLLHGEIQVFLLPSSSVYPTLTRNRGEPMEIEFTSSSVDIRFVNNWLYERRHQYSIMRKGIFITYRMCVCHIPQNYFHH